MIVLRSVGSGQPDGRVRSHDDGVGEILGGFQSFTSYGGLIAGQRNMVTAPYASVTGGTDNVASGTFSVVSGGGGNTASGYASSVTGGGENTASGQNSAVTGGQAITEATDYGRG